MTITMDDIQEELRAIDQDVAEEILRRLNLPTIDPSHIQIQQEYDIRWTTWLTRAVIILQVTKKTSDYDLLYSNKGLTQEQVLQNAKDQAVDRLKEILSLPAVSKEST